jgi:proline dehydrogenase
MIDSASKAFFHLLARSSALKALASRYGMRRPTSFARRFIAGETVEEAIDAVRRVENAGLLHTLDYLGEGVTSLAAATAATGEYLRIVDAVRLAGIGRNLSLKLTQLGLDVDRATAVDNLRRILDHAEGFFVRIDMENSPYTDVTLDVFETLWQQGYRHIGVVLQADLYRTAGDLRRMLALGARVRLVKGAYVEPRAVAYPDKRDVDAAYLRLAEQLIREGVYPAIATHDSAIIDRVKQMAAAQGVGRDRFEFQMLYGIRRDLQTALAADGFRVRVYIPFGRQWFPYFMRRLGERPANVLFVVRSLMREG